MVEDGALSEVSVRMSEVVIEQNVANVVVDSVAKKVKKKAQVVLMKLIDGDHALLHQLDQSDQIDHSIASEVAVLIENEVAETDRLIVNAAVVSIVNEQLSAASVVVSIVRDLAVLIVMVQFVVLVASNVKSVVVVSSVSHVQSVVKQVNVNLLDPRRRAIGVEANLPLLLLAIKTRNGDVIVLLLVVIVKSHLKVASDAVLASVDLSVLASDMSLVALEPIVRLALIDMNLVVIVLRIVAVIDLAIVLSVAIVLNLVVVVIVMSHVVSDHSVAVMAHDVNVKRLLQQNVQHI